MAMIQTLETNQQHEGKIAVVGCINHSITDLLASNMASGNLIKRDIDFFLPENTPGWQKWYDSHISFQNNIDVKSEFVRKKNIYEYDYSNTGTIGIAVIEGPDPDFTIKLINKVLPSIKKTGLILVPYKNEQTTSFVGALNYEFDTQNLAHMENYSYINYIKGKVPLNKNKKAVRSRSVLT